MREVIMREDFICTPYCGQIEDRRYPCPSLEPLWTRMNLFVVIDGGL
jgi:hypothetical protein